MFAGIQGISVLLAEMGNAHRRPKHENDLVFVYDEQNAFNRDVAQMMKDEVVSALIRHLDAGFHTSLQSTRCLVVLIMRADYCRVGVCLGPQGHYKVSQLLA